MSRDFKIYSAHENVDLEWTFAALKNSYWGAHYTWDGFLESVDNSVCISAHFEDWRQQIGFARIVTDKALLSHLTDVIVEERWRRQGVATAMLEAALSHPWVKNTLCICQTRYHYGLYAKFGFTAGGELLKRNPR